MFGRKKREQQMMEQVVREHKRSQMLEQQLQAAMQNQAELEKRIPKKACKAKPKAAWMPLHNDGPVAIAPPADSIQLTPIVQPVPLVPYSSQLQPMYMFDDIEMMKNKLNH